MARTSVSRRTQVEPLVEPGVPEPVALYAAGLVPGIGFLDAIDVAAQAGFTGAGAAVAVIDTGVDWTLPGVGSTFGNCSGGPGTPGCRIVKYATTVTGDPTCVDEIENDPDITGHHGTNVSGVVA